MKRRRLSDNKGVPNLIIAIMALIMNKLKDGTLDTEIFTLEWIDVSDIIEKINRGIGESIDASKLSLVELCSLFAAFFFSMPNTLLPREAFESRAPNNFDELLELVLSLMSKEGIELFKYLLREFNEYITEFNNKVGKKKGHALVDIELFADRIAHLWVFDSGIETHTDVKHFVRQAI